MELKKLIVRIDPALDSRLAHLAIDRNTSKQSLVTEAIENLIQKYKEVETVSNLEKLQSLSDLVEVSYRAYSEPPFAPDAVGYVPAGKLLPYDDERYTYYKDDELVARKGFEIVCREEDGQKDWFIVRQSNIYTKVFEHDGIAGGWAADYPGGGITSAGEPTHTDASGTLYQRRYW